MTKEQAVLVVNAARIVERARLDAANKGKRRGWRPSEIAMARAEAQRLSAAIDAMEQAHGLGAPVAEPR